MKTQFSDKIIKPNILGTKNGMEEGKKEGRKQGRIERKRKSGEKGQGKL